MFNPSREPSSIPEIAEVRDSTFEQKDALEYDPETDSYRASFDSSSESVCWAVVSMVAAISGTRRTELPSLGSAVDADALDALLHSQPSDQSSGDVHVTFDYDGHEVTVHSYGVVSVQTG